MGLLTLLAVAVGVLFGMGCGFVASVALGLPPLAMMGLGAGVGGTYMAAAT